MNTHKKFRFAYIILAAAFLLSACFPTAATNDGATIDATQAAQLIETAVAQALDAQATQIAESMPAMPEATAASVEPEATNTAIPAPATETPVPTITPLVLEPTTAPPSGGDTSVDNSYYCTFNSGKKPADLSEFSRGETFDIRFTIVNSGTKTWEKGLDVTYYNGPDLTNGGFAAATVELPELKPGQSFTVGPFDAWAPNESGRQVMTFKLEGGWCWPYVAIDVK